MLIKNAKVFIGKGFLEADVEFGKTILAVGKLSGEADIDAKGAYLVPGLIDIHTHGAMGQDFSDGVAEGLPIMADYYASRGVTGFLATTMTLKEEELIPAMNVIRDFKREKGAKCLGIHLEGPFLGYNKRGAHDPAKLHAPDCNMYDRLNAECGGIVRLITVAPDEPGAMEFISHASKTATVSLGHTSCSHEQAMEAFGRGASHVTHLFNGMDGLHHRNPGLIGAAVDAGASVELICDGLHIHPAVIRLVHRLYGDKLNLISDSLCCAGMPDGDYLLGGQTITVSGGKATLTGTNTLAGSSISMLDAVRNVVAFGLPLADAIYASTTAPADAVRLYNTGRISCGCDADLLLLDENLEIKAVFVDGELQNN